MNSRNIKTKCSYVIMGLGQFLYGQRIKGMLYMAVLALYLWYLFTVGFGDMAGFFTLGTVEGDPWLGTKGDDSIIMMLRGILAYLILISVILCCGAVSSGCGSCTVQRASYYFHDPYCLYKLWWGYCSSQASGLDRIGKFYTDFFPVRDKGYLSKDTWMECDLGSVRNDS